MHPSAGELRAFLDGEVPDERRDEIRTHIRDCPECRAEAEALEEAARVTARALAALEPTADADGALRRVRARLGAEGSRGARRFAWGSLAKAALLVLGFSAGVGAAVPGSPVRQWLGSAWSAVVGADAGETVAVGERTPERDAESAGIRVAPDGGAIRVEILEAGPGSTVTVRLVNRSTAGVTAPAESRFRTGAGRIEVRSEPGPLEIQVPSAATRIDVTVNGRTYLRVRSGRIELPGPVPEPTDDAYRFRVPGGG